MPILFPQFFPASSRRLLQYFLPKYLREAAAVFTSSHQTKQDLLSAFSASEEKVHVVYPALLPRKRLIHWEKDPFFFYIGSFEPRKNLQRIITAFHLVKARGYPHKLICAGKEEGNHCLPYDLIKKFGLEDEVVIKGYISEEEKAALFQKAALLLWPSLYEGFGLPLLEAMASGTPIVTSNCYTPKEIVGDAAVCVNPYDPEEIAEGICTILSDPSFTQSLILKGLERSQLFSLDHFAKNHIQVYEATQGL